VTPPVQAWAVIAIHRMEQLRHHRGDTDLLKRSFGKLLLNAGWWLNRRDRQGRTALEGGFLGIDAMDVLDLPAGSQVEQSEATIWTAVLCHNMLEIALELAAIDPAYNELATTFLDRVVDAAWAIERIAGRGMWDEEDGFYYCPLRQTDGTVVRSRYRSIIGLLPLCAAALVEPHQREDLRIDAHVQHHRQRRPELRGILHPAGDELRGQADRSLIALVWGERLRRILSKMLDEREFLSPFGIRSLSRVHRAHPSVVRVDGVACRVEYAPGESDTRAFGGNTNWRGPIWISLNVMLIQSLLQFYRYYGDTFTVQCPTESGHSMNLFEVARDLALRLARVFLQDEQGRRPIHGNGDRFQKDPLWRDHLLFYECFNGEDGSGLGASHKTGATGLVALLMQLFWSIEGGELLEPSAAQFLRAE
jgi:hypothetical protein